MQAIVRCGLIGVLVLSLCGCSGQLAKTLSKDSQEAVGAAPLDTTSGSTLDPAKATTGNYRAYAGLVLSASADNCLAFMNRLSLAERGIDTSFDITSTVLSALATAFTPLATVHALTAAATISTGTKTAIDSDIYAKETAPLIIQEIDNTYWLAYAAEVKRVQGLTDDTAAGPPALELSNIQAIHRECSLDYAIAQLATKNSGGGSTGNGTPAAKVSATDLKPGRVITSPVNGYQYLVTQAPTAASNTVTVQSKSASDNTFGSPQTYPVNDFLNFLNPAS